MVVRPDVKRAVSWHNAGANIDALGRSEHGGVEEGSSVVTGAIDEDFTEMADEVDFSVHCSRGGFDFGFAVDAPAPDNLSGCGVQAGDELVATVQHVEVAFIE